MEHPIIFSGPMVQAILEGSKTQTRRVIKQQPPKVFNGYNVYPAKCENPEYGRVASEIDMWTFKCPYGKPGDTLWVRETWKYYEKAIGKGASFCIKKFLAYKADEENDNVQKSSEWFEGKWHPSIHMPRTAARIFLQVKDIRVERLQDISNEDIRAEGAAEFGCTTHRLNFQLLWDSINAKRGYGWDINPWVYVIEFKRK